MKKELIALSLSGAMALSMALSCNTVASADTIANPNEAGIYSQDVTVDTTVKVPTISVDVPTSASIAINPYNLKYDVDGTEYTDSIVSVEQTIKNESDVAISVGATAEAAASTGSEVVLATAALKGTETTKSVFAYLELAPKADESTAGTYNDAYNSKTASQLVLGKKATKSDMITLEAGDTTPTYAGFKVIGSAASKPAKAWTTNDTVDVTLTFNITPVAATVAP